MGLEGFKSESPNGGYLVGFNPSYSVPKSNSLAVNAKPFHTHENVKLAMKECLTYRRMTLLIDKVQTLKVRFFTQQVVVAGLAIW